MQRFTDLKVWQRGHTFALEIYRVTQAFPTEERFGLTAQLRRAAVSVPTNIAEGSKRRRNLDYARFLNLAESSLAEVQSLLFVARDLGFLSARVTASLFREAEEISRMLSALRSKVEKA